jgi:peptidoglycan/xylan/chitin deacetylase (PgdA/CDA1 family)
MSRLIVTTSWDDGSILDLKLGELLTKYGIKATFYIPRFSKRITPMQNIDLLELAANHEIGAHTISHAHLTMVPQSEAKMEIDGSKIYLEDVTGKKIKMFCYPYGEFNEDTKQIVKASGFSGARTVKFNGLKDIPYPYEFGITTSASNHQSDESGEIARYSQAVSIKSLSDWEIKAKVLFDLAIAEGGIWHLWGHSWEIDDHNDWNKLERVINYVSHRPGVTYASNGETVDTVYSRS